MKLGKLIEIFVEDHKFLKIKAAEDDTTIKQIIRNLIKEHLKQKKGDC